MLPGVCVCVYVCKQDNFHTSIMDNNNWSLNKNSDDCHHNHHHNHHNHKCVDVVEKKKEMITNRKKKQTDNLI